MSKDTVERCRTRVFENVNGEKTSVGRGNLSFTTINLPRLAIKASSENKTLEQFREEVKALTVTVCDQLLERLKFQMTADESQFPFIIANNIWDHKDSKDYADSLRSGTLGVGFIGLHNTMMALFDESIDDNAVVYNFATKVIEDMNEVVNYYKNKHKLNFSVLATPAEGISGRFTKLDKEKFGVIPGVNDRDYYINSFHIDVAKPVSAFKKLELEAPFHKLTKGGHITYVELDGEAKNNLVAFGDIVVHSMKCNAGYISINHPIDQCKVCGHNSIIHDSCPICGNDDISRIRRITGYLVGDLDNWNSYKQAEERDRVKHSVSSK